MINNTNDGKESFRKLSSSIICNAWQAEIKVHCSATMNNQWPVVDNVAYWALARSIAHFII